MPFLHLSFLALLSHSFAAPAPSLKPRNTTISCPIIFDGRVPSNTSVTTFDTANPIFQPNYVKGANLTWSDILLTPSVFPSKFDAPSYKAVEVTIDDRSIFNNQQGFRRAELLFTGSDGTEDDPSTSGVVTLHWSVRQDAQRPMNLSHEYLNVWHETADYSADQFMFEAGTLLGSNGTDRDHWKVLGRNYSQIWSTPIDFEDWQNFAVTVDYDASTLQVYYSKGVAPLVAVTEAVSNDNSGGGQFQVGMLKKPTGTSDVINSGYQESGFSEGQVYGGLFVEDSAGDCVSL